MFEVCLCHFCNLEGLILYIKTFDKSCLRWNVQLKNKSISLLVTVWNLCSLIHEKEVLVWTNVVFVSLFTFIADGCFLTCLVAGRVAPEARRARRGDINVIATFLHGLFWWRNLLREILSWGESITCPSFNSTRAGCGRDGASSLKRFFRGLLSPFLHASKTTSDRLS